MNIEANPTVATSARTRRTVLSVAIAVIATIPIAAGSSAASDETTSPDTTDSIDRADNRARPKRRPTPSNPPSAASIVGDVRLTFTVPDGWENNGWFVLKSDSEPVLRRGHLRPCGQHLLRSLPMGGA